MRIPNYKFGIRIGRMIPVKRFSVRALCLTALLCSLMIVSTLLLRFTIPGTTVMVTSQLFFVFLYGLLFPVKICLVSLGLYLLLGLVGLPVLSGVCGPAVLFTPSFGYLLGFLVSAACMAWLRKRFRNDWLAAAAGIVAVYAVALPYIAIIAPGKTLNAFLGAYCLPFLPLDFAKAVLAVLVAKALRKRLPAQLLNQSKIAVR